MDLKIKKFPRAKRAEIKKNESFLCCFWEPSACKSRKIKFFCVVLGRQNSTKYNCGGCLESEFDKLAVLECQNPLFYKGFVTLEVPELSFYAIGKSIRSHRIAIIRSTLEIPYKTYGEWMEYLWKSAIFHTVDPVHFWTFRNPLPFAFQLPKVRVPKKKSRHGTVKKLCFSWIFD